MCIRWLQATKCMSCQLNILRTSYFLKRLVVGFSFFLQKNPDSDTKCILHNERYSTNTVGEFFLLWIWQLTRAIKMREANSLKSVSNDESQSMSNLTVFYLQFERHFKRFSDTFYFYSVTFRDLCLWSTLEKVLLCHRKLGNCDFWSRTLTDFWADFNI